ncbi:MAG: PAS domain-containing protein [Candidatus Schekmanbacteria bacterium]|nr:PAS domain-containing protein [Candidatus Schekmanbacteria bacterium]
MSRHRLLWQIYASMVLVTLAGLSAATWYASRTMRDVFVAETSARLSATARLAAREISARSPATPPLAMQALCTELARASDTRLTIIGPSGAVLADSMEDPARMENHAARPEVKAALTGGFGAAIRYSATVGTTMMYVAVPLSSSGLTRGVARAAVSIAAVEMATRAVQIRIAGAGLSIAVVAAILSLWLSRRVSRPVEELRRGAERFARGDFHPRLPVLVSGEIGALASAMNDLAAQLDDRISTILAQRNEQEAMLSSMVEGVVAVDAGERCLRLNQAACRFLGVDPLAATGKSIQEAVRNADLQRFVRQALSSHDPVESEVVLHSPGADPGTRFLQAHGTPLRSASGDKIGALVVLHDVTRLKRLEMVRRDFVANVSHELRTPITAVTGFVETLRDGAMYEPEHAARFLEIIARHADRPSAIIEDLLSLSRIEQQAERAEVPPQEAQIAPILRAAVDLCGSRAAERGIAIGLSCPHELRARINDSLLQQAVVNLLVNAVKHSEPHRAVEVVGRPANGWIEIRVCDQGCGIAAAHLPRLFERFYRVDPARSRDSGGTGLGLAIVKHIAQAHGRAGERGEHPRPGIRVLDSPSATPRGCFRRVGLARLGLHPGGLAPVAKSAGQRTTPAR